MGKAKQLSPATRAVIVALHKEGLSIREIAKRGHGGKSAVGAIIKRYKTQSTVNVKKRSGRPRVTSAREDRILIRKCLNNRLFSSRQLVSELEQSTGRKISTRTVRRRLLYAGLKSCRPAKKPFINFLQRQRRLKWCHEFRHYTPDQWKKVIFSDESLFQAFNARGQVRRRVGERYKPDCLRPTVKYPFSVMVWSCICYHGVGRLFILEKGERFNSDLYKKILEDRLLRSATEWYPDGDYMFQDDGAPCHRSKAVITHKANLGIPSLPWWPGQSPDLNIIENLWSRVNVFVQEKKPSNRSELISAIVKVWHHEITPDLIEKLVESMPRRIQAVINAKGFPTKY